jgi:O-antigen/teichoic acid export membrane protein
MGIIQRESIRSTIISYGGALLGAVNQLVLFTQLLPSEREVGLANVLVLIAITYAQLSGLGGAQIILRFFPFFRQTEKGHHGILFGILLLVTVGFGFFTLLFFLFHDQVVGYFEGNSPLIAEYIDYAVPLAYCWILLNIFDSYLRSLYKTVFATWVREIIKRGFITISVLAFAFGWVDLTGFVLLYILGQCLQPFLLLAYIAYIGELHLKPQFGRLWQQLSRKMLLYGGVSFLAYGSSLILGYIDSIMLGGMESEGEAGIYTISLYATSLILIPWRALAKITTPQVADYWQQKAHDKLQALYQRTSLINLVVGLFCFLGIWLNRHNLYAITGEAYSGGFWVLLLVGLARVFDMWTGLNAYILNLSRKYAWDLLINILMIVIGIASNYFFIQRMGLAGAALATLLTMVSINLIRLLLVWHFFRLQPFNLRMLGVFALAGFAYLVGVALPVLPHFALDLPVRSLLITAAFVGPLLGFRLVPDINEYVMGVWRKIRGKIV